MQYILLIHENESAMAARSEADRGQMFSEYMAFNAATRQSGHLVAGDALQPTSKAKSVRVREGKTAITDGPFAETKEQLGGYYLVEAKTIEEACELASRIPGARSGTVEVRPVMQIPKM